MPKKPKNELKNPIIYKTAMVSLFTIWVFVVNFFLPKLIALPALFFIDRSILTSPVGSTCFQAIAYILCILVIIFVPMLVKKSWKPTREKLGLTDLPTFTDVGIAILGFIACMIISGIIINILSNIPGFNAAEAQEIGYSSQIYGFDRVVAFIALVIVAPIAEEIIFRGWLYEKVKSYSSVAIATAVISILFGFLHGQWNVGIVVGIMSVIMCLERELTGTIYAGILTHMIKNGVAFWFLFVII